MEPEDRLVDLLGSERRPYRDARDAGPANPSEVAEVTLIVRRDSRRGAIRSLKEYGDSPLNARSRLGRGEFAATFGAREDDLSAVREFAGAHRFRVASENPGARTVRLGGSVGELSAAFGTDLRHFEFPGGAYRGRVGPVRIPRRLSGRVLGVLGLDNRPQATTHFRVRPARFAGDPAYTPLQVATAYSFPPNADGTGECIGLVELGGGYRTSDLTQYFGQLGTAAPSVTSVSVDGATNVPTGSADGPDGEVELDIEMVGSVAPGSRIVVYFAPNTDQGFLDAVSTAVHDMTNRPTILSISWGGPELSWTAQARAAFEAAFVDAAALGVTVLAASGDNGADDGGASGGLSVDYPASSPGVIGCGGTRLVLAGATISVESVWNELASGEGATGGGISEAFALPTFQAGAHVPLAPNGFAGRGVPDVAGDADPTTGYQVLVDGAPTVLGGTSAVAPLWAALIARINQLLGKPVGYVNPQLYGPDGAATFHAVLSGGNGGYTAGPGWDACTGLGTPDGTALLTALRGA
ncbi:MAG: S53 family peptidase [Thermoplasmata archaeon]